MMLKMKYEAVMNLNNIGEFVRASVWDSVSKPIFYSVYDSVRDSIITSHRRSVWGSCRRSLDFTGFSSRNSLGKSY
jgi:hypothetical protein